MDTNFRNGEGKERCREIFKKVERYLFLRGKRKIGWKQTDRWEKNIKGSV